VRGAGSDFAALAAISSEDLRAKVGQPPEHLGAQWIQEYNETRPHQGRWCFGKTPMQTFLDAMPMTKEKMIAA